MLPYQSQFLDYCLKRGVLKFGEFTLKSGRISPYFFNAGLFNRGADLSRLGEFYADAIHHTGHNFDVLFGPAYKGIPLATITASALFTKHGMDIGYAFDRKEKKDHGEGGNIVGAEISGNIMIIDDVITAGTAIRQSIELIESLGGKVSAVTIALDRRERGLGQLSAIQEIEEAGIPVVPIILLDDIMEYLESSGNESQLESLKQYRQEYGVES